MVFAGAANVGIFLVHKGTEKVRGIARLRDIYFLGSQIDFPFPQLRFPGIFIHSQHRVSHTGCGSVVN